MGRPRKPQTETEYLILDLKSIIEDNQTHTDMIRNTLDNHCTEQRIVAGYLREYFRRMVDLRKKMEYCCEFLETYSEEIVVMLPDGTIRPATANERLKALIKKCELRQERYSASDTLYKEPIVSGDGI